MLFSATMPGPIIALSRAFLDQPTHIRAEEADQGSIHERTRQLVYRAHAMDKVELLTRVLQAKDRGLTMIFARTKRTVQRVADDLADRGFAAAAVHGDLGQGAREQALRAFRSGKVDVLVATDVAARGIDVIDVTHVINYQCPEDAKTYVHRIGRTGRAGKEGVAVTLVDWDELHRWKTISDDLGLGMPEPAETYSTSEHLYADLEIAANSTGRLPHSQRTRAGLDAEYVDTAGDQGGGRKRTGDRPARGGRTRTEDTVLPQRKPRRDRSRTRSRSGVAVGESAGDAAGSASATPAGPAAGSDGTANGRGRRQAAPSPPPGRFGSSRRGRFGAVRSGRRRQLSGSRHPLEGRRRRPIGRPATARRDRGRRTGPGPRRCCRSSCGGSAQRPGCRRAPPAVPIPAPPAAAAVPAGFAEAWRAPSAATPGAGRGRSRRDHRGRLRRLRPRRADRARGAGTTPATAPLHRRGRLPRRRRRDGPGPRPLRRGRLLQRAHDAATRHRRAGPAAQPRRRAGHAAARQRHVRGRNRSRLPRGGALRPRADPRVRRGDHPPAARPPATVGMRLPVVRPHHRAARGRRALPRRSRRTGSPSSPPTASPPRSPRRSSPCRCPPRAPR